MDNIDKEAEEAALMDMDILLSNSEKYWKRIPEEFKKLLTAHTPILLFRKEIKPSTEGLKTLPSQQSDLIPGMVGTLEEQNKMEEASLIVSTADPMTLMIHLQSNNDMVYIQVNTLYNEIREWSEEKTTKIVRRYSKQFKKELDFDENSDEEILPESEEDELDDNMIDSDRYIAIDTTQKKPSVLIGVGVKAELGESVNIQSWESKPASCFVQIVTKTELIYFIFDDGNWAQAWVKAFRILLKTSFESYGGLNFEPPMCIKEITEELKEDLAVNRSKYWIDSSIILSAKSTDTESPIWRDFKLIVLNREKVLVDYIYLYTKNKNSHQLEEEILNPVLEKLGKISYYLVQNFLIDIKASEVLSLIKQQEDIEEEKRNPSWKMFQNKTQDSGIRFFLPNNPQFWDIRRKVIKNYKKLNPLRIEGTYSEIEKPMAGSIMAHTHSSMFEKWDNNLIQAMEAIELEKESLRYDLHMDASGRQRDNMENRKHKTTKRGGKWLRNKAKNIEERKKKDIENKTNIVLNTLMFDGLTVLPNTFKVNQKKKSRDCCTSF